MLTHDKTYLNLVQKVLTQGTWHDDRTGTGTRALFIEQMRFDLRQCFPLLTTKKIFWKGVVAELLWMISGSCNVKPLQAQGVHIWDEWADENGELGPVYGAQWRRWVAWEMDQYGYADGEGEIDQLKNLIEGLRENPDSRRHIITAWQPSVLHKQKLPPCHCFMQLNTCVTDEPADPHRYLDLHWYMRSADLFLGVPFNIASYALLLTMVAQEVDMIPRHLGVSFGNVHIYSNHFAQCEEQLARKGQGGSNKAGPQVKLAGDKSFFDMTIDDIYLHNYFPDPAVKGEVSV